MNPQAFVAPLEQIWSTHGMVIVGAILVLFALGGRIPAFRFVLLVVGLIYFLSVLNFLPPA